MTHFSILIHEIQYHTIDKKLFQNLTVSFSQQKIGLVGRNGVGKSTLLKLMTGELCPQKGTIQTSGTVVYVPQNPEFSLKISVAQFFECEEKINALHQISQGSVDEKNFEILNEEWDIEERLQQNLKLFGLEKININRLLSSLSGGELTRLFLTKAFYSNADLLIFDEPTNHLDRSARMQFYTAVKKWQKGMIIVSHDRTLLNLMDETIELTTLGAKQYGGHYDFFMTQKQIEQAALEQKRQDAEKQLLNNKTSIQQSREKHEQKQSYGRELRLSGKIDKIGANSKKGRSEKTQSQLSIKKERMMEQAQSDLKSAKEQIEIIDEIHVDLPETYVPNGKLILEIEDLYFSYSEHKLIENFNLKIHGPERIALMGDNGSGKTTLIKLILNKLVPQQGKINRGTDRINYLDQECQLLNPDISILDNFLKLNPDATLNDAHKHLAAFLFKNTAVKLLVKNLSGGEKIRALLCCVLMSRKPPQLLILDEPTNHLDIHSVQIIESALRCYQGAMMVISHDERFLENMRVDRIIPSKAGTTIWTL
jgi:ATPase subunit of ABC transporter with duplicated ATPase domains